MNDSFGYDTAIRIVDDSKWPVLSDFNMVGSTWSISNHNKSGVQTKTFNRDITDEIVLKTFSIGGNSCYIDGSVRWFTPSAMTFYKETSDGVKTGMYKVLD